MGPLAVHYFTEEEYLALEREAEYRSEYHDGQIFAMSGGTATHSLISGNAVATLHAALRGRDCRVYTSDLKIRLAKTRSVVYPDAFVIRGPPRIVSSAKDVVDNPILVVEVLSPSTQKYDRTAKLARYKSLDSLMESLLVSQHEPVVELHARQADGEWKPAEIRGLDATIRIEGLDISLPLATIYEKVDFGE